MVRRLRDDRQSAFEGRAAIVAHTERGRAPQRHQPAAVALNVLLHGLHLLLAEHGRRHVYEHDARHVFQVFRARR